MNASQLHEWRRDACALLSGIQSEITTIMEELGPQGVFGTKAHADHHRIEPCRANVDEQRIDEPVQSEILPQPPVVESDLSARLESLKRQLATRLAFVPDAQNSPPGDEGIRHR